MRVFVDTKQLCAQEAETAGVSVQSAFFVVRDEAEIPALERGSIARLLVRPGALVQQGQELGSLDDQEAALSVDVAQLDLLHAQKQVAESRSIEIAEASLFEASRLLQQSQEEAAIAARMAEDDSAVQMAQKDEQIARDGLERARVSRGISRLSVSEQDWFRLQREHEKQQVATGKAQVDLALAKLRSRSRQFSVQQQQAVVSQLEHKLEEARSTSELQQIELQSLQKALQIAQARLERRRLKAPFQGVMVEQKKHVGEWVEAGEPVLRLISLSTLCVEGFADADDAQSIRPGFAVRVEATSGDVRVSLDGTLEFISPEVDANDQVLVRAVVKNPHSELRPGERAEMVILGKPANAAAAAKAAAGPFATETIR